MRARAGQLPGPVPVTPDDEQARQWVRDELSGPAYREAEPGLVERALQGLADWLGSALIGVESASPVTGTLFVAALAVAVLLVVFLVVRPRMNAGPRREGGVFEDDGPTDANDHRRLAAAALQHGDFNEALAQWLRAVIRTAEERTLLDRVPGLTATEAGTRLSGVFPAEGQDIFWLADRFNEVRYGGASADASDAARAQALDARLRASVPAGPGTPQLQAPAVPR